MLRAHRGIHRLHGYFGIDNDIIWDIVTSELALLRQALRELDVRAP